MTMVDYTTRWYESETQLKQFYAEQNRSIEIVR